MDVDWPTELSVGLSAGRCLPAALYYAQDLGWPVCTAHWPVDRKCSCGNPECPKPAKHPAFLEHGFNSATTDPDLIRSWWEMHPFANVGVKCGPPGPTVIDVDGPLGKNSWLHFVDGVGWERSSWASTGGGGWHVMYEGDPDVGSLTRWLDHVDVRGVGGFVIAPPSLHVFGTDYYWQYDPTERTPQPMPAKVRAALVPKRRATVSPAIRPPQRNGRGYGQAALDGECDRLRATAEGVRNNTLNECAFNVGQLVGDGRLDRTDAEGELLMAALACGLGERESKATIASGLDAGIHHPRDNR